MNLELSWNVAPMQMAPVVRRHPETAERQFVPARALTTPPPSRA
jgi:hypothetical protein